MNIFALVSEKPAFFWKACLFGLLLQACGGGDRFYGGLEPQQNPPDPADHSQSDDNTENDSPYQAQYEVESYRLNWGTQEKQFGDLYRPLDLNSELPVIIMIHGGCWSGSFDLSLQADLSRALAAYGFAVWNIEYRALGTGGEWPSMFLDVAAAADFLKSISFTENLDLNRVVAMGHSAGGHLALWLASRENIALSSVLHSDSPLSVSKAVSLGGIPDLRERVCGSATLNIIDEQALSDSELDFRLEQSSPIQMLPLGLPTLLISGENDSIAPVFLSQNYTEAALVAGDNSQHFVLEGADHFDLIDSAFLDMDWFVREIFSE